MAETNSFSAGQSKRYLLKGELLLLLLVILESEALSTRIQIFLNPPLFFVDSRISTSTHIRIQIEFAHPHVSDRCPGSL